MRSLTMMILAAAFATWTLRAEARASEPQAVTVLVCYPAAMISDNEAKPAMDAMLHVLEELGDWPRGTITSLFTSDAGKCRQMLAEKKPGFVIASLGLYVEERAAEHLIPLATPQIDGQTTESYRLLVRRGTFASLEELAGKLVGGVHLGEPLFLERVVFKGKIAPESHFKLKPSRRALRALRELAAGKLDAVLVNEQEYRALGALPFAGKLDAVYSSDPVPLMGVAANATRTSADERVRLAKALTGMCGHGDGKPLCELFGIDSFTAADQAAYERVAELWGASARP